VRDGKGFDCIFIDISPLIDQVDIKELEEIIDKILNKDRGLLLPYLTKLTRFLPQDRGIIYKASWHDMEVADV
jgi:hypothetical protein